MLGLIEITPWHWAGFILCVIFFLALDLGVFHREAHVVKFKEALTWSSVWFTVSMLFAMALVPLRGRTEAVEFVTGYLIELSLSMDNVFVIALIFAYFRVPSQYQHRVLFWGILGALIMRGLMIAAGAALIQRFMVTLYLFGAFLVFTGVKMLFVSDEEVHPEKNPALRLAKRFFRVTPELHGQKFSIRSSPREIKMSATPEAGAGSISRGSPREIKLSASPQTAGGSISRGEGKFMLTPLALVLLMVETTDLIFAVDSIPAIFAVTTKPFIVFTSNVFAILGLRSLYFVLAGAIEYFRYLKIGLSFVLVFIGAKMLLDPHGQPEKWFQVTIASSVSLLVVAVILATSIALSVTAAKREARAARGKSESH